MIEMLPTEQCTFPAPHCLETRTGDDVLDDVLIEVCCRRNRRIAEAWRVYQD
jgi:hypothetical protein